MVQQVLSKEQKPGKLEVEQLEAKASNAKENDNNSALLSIHLTNVCEQLLYSRYSARAWGDREPGREDPCPPELVEETDKNEVN